MHCTYPIDNDLLSHMNLRMFSSTAPNLSTPYTLIAAHFGEMRLLQKECTQLKLKRTPSLPNF